MKINRGALLIVAICILSAHPLKEPTPPSLPWACTSFAVYNDGAIYGMNFDYPDVPIRFTIREFGELKVFQMEFKDGDNYVPTVGMNSAGLFASSQMLFPELPPTPVGDETQMTIWQLYQSGLYKHKSVAEVLTLIEDYQISNSGLTLHDLFADPKGGAAVVEVINDQEVVSEIEGQFIVMTNFPVSAIQDKPLDAIEGVGADRYQIAAQSILSNLEDFRVADGLKTLEETVLQGEYSTQASMVFDPINLQVYISLNRDFSQVWLVSLSENSLETFRGFPSNQVFQLDHRGVTESQMIAMGQSSDPEAISISDLLLPVGFLSVLILIIWVYKRSPGKNGWNKTEKPD